MKPRRLDAFGRVLPLALLVGIATSHRAAEAQSLPLGGRTASMGGAGTAAGRDGAMPLVNPAGFGAVPSTTISLSASLYRYERLVVDDFFYSGELDPELGELVGEPDVTRNELSSSEFSAFPGAASVLWHFGPDRAEEGTHHVVNASVIVSRSAQLALAGDFALTFDSGATLQDRITQVSDTTVYHFGPGYALKSGALQLGAQLSFSYIDGVQSTTSTTRFFQPDGFLTNERSSFREVYSIAFQPVLGAQLRFPAGLALGLSFSPTGIPIVGSTDHQYQQQTVLPVNVQGAELVAGRSEGDFDRTLPMTIRGGIAFEQPRSWAAALDAVVRMPNSDAVSIRTTGLEATQVQGFPVDVDAVSESGTFSERGAVALHAGGEYFLNELVALRGGVFYEPSVVELRQDANDVLALQQDAYGLSAGLGLENDLGEVTFGTTLSYASGKTVAYDIFSAAGGGDPEFPLVDANTFAAVLFVSGAVDVGELSNWMKAARDPAVLFDVEHKTLAIADLDPALAALAASPEYAALEPKSTTFVVTQSEAYDRFFERAARIRLTVEFTTALLAAMQSNLRALTNGPEWTEQRRLSLFRHVFGGGAELVPPDLTAAPHAADVARMLRGARAAERLARSLATDVAAMPGAGEELVQRAQVDFKGPGVMLLPAALRGLGRAQSDLAISAQRLPSLFRAFSDVFAVFTGKLSADPANLPRELGSRRLRLSDLDPALADVEGSAAMDALSAAPMDVPLSGIAELDAALVLAATTEMCAIELAHVHGYVQSAIEVARPRWRQRGLNPETTLVELRREAAQGRSTSTVPEAGEVLRGLRVLHIVTASSEARANQVPSLRFELRRLSTSLDWALGERDVPELRAAIAQAEARLERAEPLLSRSLDAAKQFSERGAP